ncbi:MAG: hypothetical protein QOJ46_2321 [bacterium]
MTTAGPAEARGLRRCALTAASDAVGAELAAAPVDEQFVLVLQACARGGQRALEALCDAIADPASDLGEAPAIALVEAVASEAGAVRAVRAAAWVMTAQRIAETWPGTWFDVLEVAREALPLSVYDYERVRNLTLLTVTAVATDDPNDRDGMHFQFLRESLEDVIAAATGRRPVRRDMLHVIPWWTQSFREGVATCDEHLRDSSRS